MNAPRLIGFLMALALSSLAVSGCAECTKDYDCAGAQICSAEEGECVPFLCRAHGDCPPGHTCAANRCQETPARPSPEPGPPVVLQPAE